MNFLKIMNNKTWRWIALVFATVLVAIIIPNFFKARTTTGNEPNCVARMMVMEDAQRQWAKDSRKGPDDLIDVTGVVTYLKGGSMPVCPQGGTYHLGPTVKDRPTCSKGKELGHTLH